MLFEAYTELSCLRPHQIRLHPAGATMPQHATCAFDAVCCKGAALLSLLQFCSFDDISRPMQRDHINE